MECYITWSEIRAIPTLIIAMFRNKINPHFALTPPYTLARMREHSESLMVRFSNKLPTVFMHSRVIVFLIREST